MCIIVTMNTLDYIIMGLAVIGGIWGAIKGLIDELSDKFGYVLGLAVAMMFTVLLAPVFEAKLGLPVWLASFLSYVVLFLVGFTVMKIFGKILGNISETAHLGAVDRILGFVLGLLEAVVVIGFAETILSSQHLINVSGPIGKSWVSGKIILPVFNAIRSWIQSLL